MEDGVEKFLTRQLNDACGAEKQALRWLQQSARRAGSPMAEPGSAKSSSAKPPPNTKFPRPTAYTPR